ncbi:hypothetical protein O3P69_015720 [Scylla paramamosain]|uniref:Pro-resilin n=1 Tax=Scylla paramamosain TaxID=85552 RepID=A0AAW0T9P8_SCYPA
MLPIRAPEHLEARFGAPVTALASSATPSPILFLPLTDSLPPGPGGSCRRRGVSLPRGTSWNGHGCWASIGFQSVTQHCRHDDHRHDHALMHFASLQDSYGASSEEAKYEFSYQVKDDEGNDFGHEERRDGDHTQGSYYNELPDGRRQTVTYKVKGDSGYVADVKYSGEAHYDSSSYESRESESRESESREYYN